MFHMYLLHFKYFVLFLLVYTWIWSTMRQMLSVSAARSLLESVQVGSVHTVQRPVQVLKEKSALYS